jgi:predicted membrane GTPase involved in stress response
VKLILLIIHGFGRGVHLSVLIETMKKKGMSSNWSAQVIIKIDGKM